MDHIPTVPRADELLDRAFRKASRIEVRRSSARKDTQRKIDSTITYVEVRLDRVVRSFPSFEHLHSFYLELFDLMFGVDRARHSLGAVQWAHGAIHRLRPVASKRLSAGDDPDRVRRMVYGRMASILHDIADDLLDLDRIRRMMLAAPELDFDRPIVVICGYPNVGKSTLVRRITTAEPKVAQYPFTTKEVHLGHMELAGRRVQVMDTPGLFDRPVEEMNPIERQGIAALRHIADVAVVIMDPTETCGYRWESQVRLLDLLRGWFDVPLIVVENKADSELFVRRLDDSIPLSALDSPGGELEGLLSRIAELLPPAGPHPSLAGDPAPSDR